MRVKTKHVAEYAILRAVGGLLQALPYRAALAVACALARLTYAMAGRRVQTTKARIREVFGDALSAREVDRIAWLSWRNLVFVGVDVLRLPRVTKKWARSVAKFGPALETLRAHQATGRGAILVTAHMGSWELGGTLSSLFGMPIVYVFADQKNALFNAYLTKLRTRHGATGIARGSGSTMKAVVRALKNGGFLAMPVDLRSPRPGFMVDFLGGRANVRTGTAVMAWLADVPVFPCVSRRIGWSRHEFRVCAPIVCDRTQPKQQAMAQLTQQVFSVLDEAIRAQPDQWFWYNKRWVLDPLREIET